jgi:prefoldin alpha subunit
MAEVEKPAAGKEQKITLSAQQLIGMIQNERQNFEAVQRSIGNAQLALQETIFATDALKAIVETKKGEKIMLPLGAGIYTEALVEDNARAKASLAGGVLLEKPIEEILKDLDGRKAEIEKGLAAMQKDQEKIAANLNSLTGLLRAIEQKVAEQRAGKSA